MQHITRYPMLLESVQKIDQETEASDVSYIEAVTLEIKSIAQLVNQRVRKKDLNVRALQYVSEFQLNFKMAHRDQTLLFEESFVGVLQYNRNTPAT